MKKHLARKLTLKLETLATLQHDVLAGVVGGMENPDVIKRPLEDETIKGHGKPGPALTEKPIPR